MMYRYLIFFLLIPLLAVAEQSNKTISNVIYITLDGTSWQDVFRTKGVFQKLWTKHGKEGKFYGNPASNIRIEVASVPTSLPSYQSQMAGTVQPCYNNDCGRIRSKTFLEALLKDRNLSKKDVVVFGSWHKIAHAVESNPGTILTNVGNEPFYDPITHRPDHEMSLLNRAQSHDYPRSKDRFDKYTFAQALHYFKVHQPKFIWIALTDADEAAHQNNKKAYYDALSFYDDALDQLFEALKKKKLTQSTLLIITTDHGRANGSEWMNHGPKYPSSRKIWAYVMNGTLEPNLIDQNVYYYSTLSMRPTIEKAFQSMKSITN